MLDGYSDICIYGYTDGWMDVKDFVYNNPAVEDESCLQLKYNLFLTGM